MNDRIVIVGAGHAGGRCALQLRQKDYTGDITLVGAEPWLPYERPPLSKRVLLDNDEFSKCYIASEEKWIENRIEYVLDSEIAEILRDESTVVSNNSKRYVYDKLVLAIGGICRKLTCDGVHLDRIFELRTRADSFSISKFLTDKSRVVIVGGGFIGLEVAASARTKGCQVTVIETEDRLLGRVFPQPISKEIQKIHENQGVEFVFNDSVESFSGAQGVEAVNLRSGLELPADMVVIGIGIDPNTNLANDAGLQIENGIFANEYCQSSDSNIYVIGDCANAYNSTYQKQIRLESWQNAEHQADVVANHISGNDQPWKSVPWFWSDQYIYNIQMAGQPSNGSEQYLRGNIEDGAVLYYQLIDDKLVSAVAIGEGTKAARDLRVSLKLIEAQIDVSVEALCNSDIKLKSLLK